VFDARHLFSLAVDIRGDQSRRIAAIAQLTRCRDLDHAIVMLTQTADPYPHLAEHAERRVITDTRDRRIPHADEQFRGRYSTSAAAIPRIR
jgi:hypothetical protein